MPDTSNRSGPQAGKISPRTRRSTALGFQALDYTGFDYTLDRIEGLEQDLARLKEELRQSREASFQGWSPWWRRQPRAPTFKSLVELNAGQLKRSALLRRTARFRPSLKVPRRKLPGEPSCRKYSIVVFYSNDGGQSMTQYSTSDLSRKSGDIIAEALRRPVTITQRNKPRLVLLSIEDYRKLTARADTRKAAGWRRCLTSCLRTSSRRLTRMSGRAMRREPGRASHRMRDQVFPICGCVKLNAGRRKAANLARWLWGRGLPGQKVRTCCCCFRSPASRLRSFCHRNY